MLATAIDMATRLEFEPCEEIDLESANFPGRVRFDPAKAATSNVPPDGLPGWGRYVWASLAVMRDLLPDRPIGFKGRITGTLPGSGLSSSASVLLACMKAWAEVNGFELTPRDQVLRSVAAENEHVGVACGVLDPAAIVGSVRGALLLIDSDRVEWDPTPIAEGTCSARFLVVSTGTDRNLASTNFNRRVAECREAARLAAARLGVGSVERLGDLERESLRGVLAEIPGLEGRRARHFVEECDRVTQARVAWAAGRLEEFGAVMTASCRSSIELYEAGSAELIALQAIFESTDGVLGARFNGAGFGGSSLSLVAEGAVEEVGERVLARFVEACPESAGRASWVAVESAEGLSIR